MIKKGTETVIGEMLKCGIIKEEERELYRYAIQSFLLLLAPLGLGIVIGSFLGSAMQGILFALPFMILRKFSGGYHARSIWECLISSSFLFLLCMILASKIVCDWKLAIITIIASMNLIICSPIDHKNKRLTGNEKQSYKKVTANLVVLCLIIDSMFFLLKLNIYSVSFSLGIQLTAALQIPCVLEKYFVDQKYG